MVPPLESIAETQPQLPSGLAEIVSYYFHYFREALLHHRQSEIITVATLVAHLVFVAPDDERRLVRKIAKRTGN